MRCGAHAFLSPNFGALATPMPWQAMQVDSYTALPSAALVTWVAGVLVAEGVAGAAADAGLAAAGAAAGAAGSLKLAPAEFAMYTTARSTSRSVRSAAPPRGGIAPLPLSATCSSAFCPVRMRGAQSALLPNFGALATPAVWQAVHTDWKTCSPVLSAFAPPPPPATATSATGLMRAAISSGDIAFWSAIRPLVASCDSSTMRTIGTTNASTSTVTSCLGVLIRDWCESPLIGRPRAWKRKRAL